MTSVYTTSRLWRQVFCAAEFLTVKHNYTARLEEHSFITTQNIQSLSWRRDRVLLYFVRLCGKNDFENKRKFFWEKYNNVQIFRRIVIRSVHLQTADKKWQKNENWKEEGIQAIEDGRSW